MGVSDFLRRGTSHVLKDMAGKLERMSHDPRLDEERRSAFQDKAGMWRDISRGLEEPHR